MNKRYVEINPGLDTDFIISFNERGVLSSMQIVKCIIYCNVITLSHITLIESWIEHGTKP